MALIIRNGSSLKVWSGGNGVLIIFFSISVYPSKGSIKLSKIIFIKTDSKRINCKIPAHPVIFKSSRLYFGFTAIVCIAFCAGAYKFDFKSGSWPIPLRRRSSSIYPIWVFGNIFIWAVPKFLKMLTSGTGRKYCAVFFASSNTIAKTYDICIFGGLFNILSLTNPPMMYTGVRIHLPHLQFF